MLTISQGTRNDGVKIYNNIYIKIKSGFATTTVLMR